MLDVQEIIQRVANRVGPSVIGLGRGARGGSGVVIAPGQVVTLARNLRADEITAVLPGGREAPASIVGEDPDLDIAVLALDTGDAVPVTFDGAGEPAIGSALVALGNPAGRGLRVTAGHVSSAPRSVRGSRGRLISGVIEHTAPLPRGSGGGPLVDVEGRLLGLNAVRVDGGLILALPAAAVAEAARRIAAGEPSTALRLGVAVLPAHVSRRMRRAVGLDEREGLLVRGVEGDGAAERAGLRRGDLIVSAGGRDVRGIDDLHDALEAVGLGMTLDLVVVRATEEHALTATFQ